MNETLAKLRDIKPPVEVPDASFWIFVGGVSLLLALIVAALLYTKLRGRRPRRIRRRPDPVEIARERLRAIDYADAKGAVYAFDEYLPVLIGKNPELMAAFEALRPELEPYKYKKSVPPLDAATKRKMAKLVKKALKHG